MAEDGIEFLLTFVELWSRFPTDFGLMVCELAGNKGFPLDSLAINTLGLKGIPQTHLNLGC